MGQEASAQDNPEEIKQEESEEQKEGTPQNESQTGENEANEQPKNEEQPTAVEPGGSGTSASSSSNENEEKPEQSEEKKPDEEPHMQEEPEEKPKEAPAALKPKAKFSSLLMKIQTKQTVEAMKAATLKPAGAAPPPAPAEEESDIPPEELKREEEKSEEIQTCACCCPTNRQKYKIALKYQSSYYVGHNTDAVPCFPCCGYMLVKRPEGLFVGIGTVAYLYLLLLVAIVFLIMFVFSAVQCVAFFFAATDTVDEVPILQRVLPGYVASAYEAGRLRIGAYYWSVAALVIVIFVLNVGLCVIPHMLKKNSQATDAATVSPADYTLYFSGIPQSYSSAKHVYDGLRHWGTIDSVMLMYDVTKYAPNQRKLDEMMQGYRTALTTEHRKGEVEYPFARYYLSDEDYMLEVEDPDTVDTGCLFNLLRKVGLYQDKHYFAQQAKKLCDERRTFDDPSLKPSAGVAVVTFSYKSTALRVITAYRKDRQIFKEPIKGLHIEKHVEPSDIIYENLMSAKNWGAIFFWLILVLAVLIGGVILKDYLYGVDEQQNNTYLHVLIIVVNKILTFTLAFLVDMFVNSLQCQTQTMMALISATLTTIVNFSLSVGLEYFRYISYYGADISSDSSLYMSSFWFDTHAQDLAVTVIGDMAITLVLTLLHPVQIVQHVLYFLLSPWLPQVQLNLSLAPPIWSLSASLSAISTVVLNSCLVGSFFPPVFLVTCLFFFGLFIVDDRNLSVFYRVPPHYSDEALNIFNFFMVLGSVLYTVTSLATYFFLPRHTGAMVDDYSGIYVPSIILLTVTSVVIFYWIAYYPSQHQLDKQADLDDDIEALWEAMHNEQVRRKAILFHQQQQKKSANFSFGGIADMALKMKKAAKKAKDMVKKQKMQQTKLSFTEAQKDEEEKKKQKEKEREEREKAGEERKRQREKAEEERRKQREQQEKLKKMTPKKRAEYLKKEEESKAASSNDPAQKEKEKEEERKKKEEAERKKKEEEEKKKEYDPEPEMSTKFDETEGVPFPMYAAFITTYVELHPLYADRILQSHEYVSPQMAKKHPEKDLPPLPRGVIGTDPPDTYLYTTSVASPEEIPKERRCESTRQTIFTNSHTHLTVRRDPTVENQKNEIKLKDFFKEKRVYEYEDTHPPVYHQFFSFYAPRRLRPRRPWKKLPDFEITSEIKHGGMFNTAKNLEKIRNWGTFESKEDPDLLELQRLHAAATLFKYPPIILKSADAVAIAKAGRMEMAREKKTRDERLVIYHLEGQERKKKRYYPPECYIDIVEVNAQDTSKERFRRDPPSVMPMDAALLDDDLSVEELQKKYRELRRQLKNINTILQN